MSIISGVSGPWWGLRCCRCDSDYDCSCVLHKNPDATSVDEACVSGAFLTIEPFDIEAITRNSTPEHPCPVDWWDLGFWGGTYWIRYPFNIKDTNPGYCTFHWAQWNQISDAVTHLDLWIQRDGIAWVQAINKHSSYQNAIWWRRQLFTGEPPWNFLEAGEFKIPFYWFSGAPTGYDANCDFSGVADVTVKFVNYLGNNPWAP